MTKNSFLNASLAAAYIIIVGSIMFYGPKFFAPKDTVLAPIAVLSLFTLSAAVMGYLFLSEPLKLYLDGEKTNAVRLFLRTVLIFACITVFIFLLLLLRIFF